MKNHDVDTVLTLDEHRTIQDGLYGFCICLRVDLLRRRHVGLCAAYPGPATNDDERAFRHLARNGPIDSQFSIRARPTCLLGFVQGASGTSVLTTIGDTYVTQPMRGAPRRYIVDGTGQRVLFGLTIAETIEFETLDRPDAPLETGLRFDQNKPGQRWLELYAKHERAWRNWMADTRAGREVPLVLN